MFIYPFRTFDEARYSHYLIHLNVDCATANIEGEGTEDLNLYVYEVWNVVLAKYAFWYVARVCSCLKLIGIHPSGCERHRIQNFFFCVIYLTVRGVWPFECLLL